MKIKHILSIILVFVLCFGVCSFALADENTEVPEGYTPIYTAEDLYNIRNDLDGKFILMNDIDLSVYENWKPIGSSETPFTGELDGNGKSIFNMTIKGDYTESDTLYFALFTSIKNSVISDLGIIGIDVDVTFTGTSYKTFRAGSLSGYTNTSTVENCIASGKIKLNGFYEGAAGGFFGKENASSLSQCVNHIDITVISERIYGVYIGGITGISTNDTINKCANYGDFSVESIDSDNEARILKTGGISGDNSSRGVISNCFNRGNTNINFCMPLIYAGGITGECCTVENGYNIGRILVSTNFAGFIGGVSGDFWPGGLAVMPSPKIKNAYYINKELYPSYIMGSIVDNYNFDNVKTLTEEDFKNQISFVGFDFEEIWGMEENGYPVLQNQPVLPENIPERPTTAESTTESTTEPSTEPDTETSTESTVENSTEDITEPSTEPSDNECPLTNLWIVKAIKWLLDSIWSIIENISNLF